MERKNKVFISGAISRYLGSEEGEIFVVNKFASIAYCFNRVMPDFEVFNPVDLTKSLGWNATHEEYMRECMKQLETCTHIFFCQDWFYSEGSRAEMKRSEELGLIQMFEFDPNDTPLTC